MAASRRRVDPDAADYFARIAAAGSTISAGNQAAVNAFVIGCKADGIWSAIKASCILAGADDLTGALVPLVGAAPTSFNFVAGDYSRTTGLKGNASTKYLNLNRLGSSDPSTNRHLYTYLTEESTGGQTYIGMANSFGNSFVARGSGSTSFRANCSGGGASIVTHTWTAGGYGAARKNGTQVEYSVGSLTGILPKNSSTNNATAQNLFRASNGAGYVNSRHAFYSLGEYLDFSLLNARITTLMSSLT
jgi:hypothetical protein